MYISNPKAENVYKRTKYFNTNDPTYISMHIYCVLHNVLLNINQQFRIYDTFFQCEYANMMFSNRSFMFLNKHNHRSHIKTNSTLRHIIKITEIFS